MAMSLSYAEKYPLYCCGYIRHTHSDNDDGDKVRANGAPPQMIRPIRIASDTGTILLSSRCYYFSYIPVTKRVGTGTAAAAD